MDRATWLKPWVMGLGLGIAAAIVVLNVSALVQEGAYPLLTALDFVLDLGVLTAGISAIVWLGMRQDAFRARTQTAIDESEARLEAILDSAMDAIITLDDEQRIVLFNSAAEAVFRCRRRDAIGGKLDRFLPMRFREAHRAHVERFGKTGITNRKMGDAGMLLGLRADGEEFPLEASISHVGVGGRQLYTVILRDVTRRKQFEDALRRQQEELRELSARVLEAREEEKTLIARELHDELGQLLTALKMDLAWLRERLPADSAELGAKAGQMNALLDRTVTSVRRIAADLRPLMLDDLGLADGIAWLIDDFSGRSALRVSLKMPQEGALEGLDRNVAITVYRVLQEAITNVARHAKASNVWIVLGADGNALQLDIEDDGRGISEQDLARPRSLGLKGMRERVLHLGGALDVGRAPRGGTRVSARLPRMPLAAGSP